MRRTVRISSVLLVISMFFSVSAYAAPQRAPTAEDAPPAADPTAELSAFGFTAGSTVMADSLPPSSYATLTGQRDPDAAGLITVAADVQDAAEVQLDSAFLGSGLTAVYAHGAAADAALTGTVIVAGQDEHASPVTGRGAALVAHGGAHLSVDDAMIGASGAGRAALVASDGATVTVNDSQLQTAGGSECAVVLTNSSPALNLVRAGLVAECGDLLSSPEGKNAMVTAVDTDLIFQTADGAPAGVASRYAGGACHFYYGATVSGAAIGAVLDGACTAVYGPSDGTIPLYDSQGEQTGAVTGQGRPTSVSALIGFLMTGDMADGAYVDSAFVNAERSPLVHQSGSGAFTFRKSKLTAGSGVLVQMIGGLDGAPVSEPGALAVTFTEGAYRGHVYNGSTAGAGDRLTVTIGEGALLNGDVALTEAVYAIPYSQQAMQAVAACGDGLRYTLLDSSGEATTGNDGTAAYILPTAWTDERVLTLGQVMDSPSYNGVSAVQVTVEDGGVWVVNELSLLTGLTVAEGGTVYGELSENTDGTLTLQPSAALVEPGDYGAAAQPDQPEDTEDRPMPIDEAPAPEPTDAPDGGEQPPAPESTPESHPDPLDAPVIHEPKPEPVPDREPEEPQPDPLDAPVFHEPKPEPIPEKEPASPRPDPLDAPVIHEPEAPPAPMEALTAVRKPALGRAISPERHAVDKTRPVKLCDLRTVSAVHRL